MIEESELEIMEIAQMSEELTRSNPNLEFIGITPNLADFGVTRMWRASSDTSSAAYQAITAHIPRLR